MMARQMLLLQQLLVCLLLICAAVEHQSPMLAHSVVSRRTWSLSARSNNALTYKAVAARTAECAHDAQELRAA